MSEEECFQATKIFVENYNKTPTPGQVPKHWFGFSYLHSEDYEIDLKFDETEMKKKSDHSSDNKNKIFCKTIVVIEEEWFDGMNLTYGATFLMSLIKRAKSRIN